MKGAVAVLPDVLRSLLVFVLLLGAAFGALLLHERLPERHRQDDTLGIVRLLASSFVVMAALVLGLLLNSARNNFGAVESSVRIFATELLLLDHALLTLGPEAAPSRQLLAAYVRQALDGTWGDDHAPVVEDPRAEQLLMRLGAGLRALRPGDAVRMDDWRDAMQAYRSVVRHRWSLIEASGAAVPRSLVRIVVAWLILIFASFGYRAPRNAVVVVSLIVGAFLVSAAVYLVYDLSAPFQGVIRVSPEPLRSVLDHLRPGP